MRPGLGMLMGLCLGLGLYLGLAGAGRADTAIALGTSIEVRGSNGIASIAVTPGERVTLEAGDLGLYTIDHDGTIGTVITDNLAIQADPKGCFKLSLSDAFESEFFDVSVRGRPMTPAEKLNGFTYRGPSLEVTASLSASAEFEAAVEFCLTVQPGDLLEPDTRRVQNMVVLGFTRPKGDGWSVSTTTSLGFSAEAGLKATLEAYCNDEFLDPPRTDVSFTPIGTGSDFDFYDVVRTHGQNYDVIGQCVWAARAMDGDFPYAFVLKRLPRLDNRDGISALLRRCRSQTRATSAESCSMALATMAGLETNAVTKLNGIVTLSQWIAKERADRLASCPMELCDDACQAAKLTPPVVFLQSAVDLARRQHEARKPRLEGLSISR